MEPNIDAKTKKKSWKIEVAAKTAKMLQNGWQKGSRKHPKSSKKRYKKRIENGGRFFAPKGVLLSFEAEKVCKTLHTSVNSNKKACISFESETPTCAPVEAKR